MPKILIIDDHEESKTLLKQAFSDTHPLVLVDNLIAAKDVYQTSSETLGLIFLDIDALTSETTDAALEDRQSPLFQHIPTFLITNHDNPNPNLTSCPVAITGQLQRPLDIKQIRDAVDQFLK